MPALNFSKDKYVRILRSSGIDTALTILHQDIRNWEYQSFEGENGYQPAMIQELDEVREFSRELWQIALDNVSTTHLET